MNRNPTDPPQATDRTLLHAGYRAHAWLRRFVALGDDLLWSYPDEAKQTVDALDKWLRKEERKRSARYEERLKAEGSPPQG